MLYSFKKNAVFFLKMIDYGLHQSPFIYEAPKMAMKLPAHRRGFRARYVIYIAPLDSAYPRFGWTRHVPASAGFHNDLLSGLGMI